MKINIQQAKHILMVGNSASMIDLFNRDNIEILEGLGYSVDIAANFEEGSITSQDRVEQYRKELEEAGKSVFDIPFPRSINLKEIKASYRTMKQLANTHKYSLVHCQSPTSSVICRWAFRDERKHGTTVIYMAHGFHFFEGAPFKYWLLYYPIEKFMSRFTDVLILINHEDYERAKKKFHAKKICYVPGIGKNTEEYQNVAVDKDQKRKELGLTSSDFVFMSTGQLSVRKNHEVVIRALSKIENVNVKYLVVGFGELEEQLQKLCQEFGVADRVIFAGYRSDVKELLHCVDCFVLPSLQEGLSAALMEAMASGLPVVCSRIRGNTDLIENGAGGYLYSCHDVDGFAEGMQKIACMSENSRRNMGAINVNNMKQKFDAKIVRKQMREIYSSI